MLLPSADTVKLDCYQKTHVYIYTYLTCFEFKSWGKSMHHWALPNQKLTTLVFDFNAEACVCVELALMVKLNRTVNFGFIAASFFLALNPDVACFQIFPIWINFSINSILKCYLLQFLSQSQLKHSDHLFKHVLNPHHAENETKCLWCSFQSDQPGHLKKLYIFVAYSWIKWRFIFF